MKIKFLFSLLFLFYALTIKAQPVIGVQAGASYIFGVKLMPTIGAHFITDINEQIFQIGLNYHLPFKYIGESYANPIDPNTGSQIRITYTEKISIFDLHVFYRYYFGDNSFEDGGFYGMGGITLALARSKVTPGPYDATKYRLGSDFDDPNTTYFQPYLSLGIGYDKVLDNEQIIGFQFLLNLNATSYNSRSGASGDQSIPSFIGLRALYSLPLGN